MSIKGLREALTKKRAQQQPQQQDTGSTVEAVKPRQGAGPALKPYKKVTGRGR